MIRYFLSLMRCNIRSVNSTLRAAGALNDTYESNELNLPLADRYSAGILDIGEYIRVDIFVLLLLISLFSSLLA